MELAVIRALEGWRPSEPVDLAPLLPFFNGLLDGFAWWDRAWRVTRVEAPSLRENTGSGPTEVSVPGTVSRAGDELPFFGRVRFSGDQLIRFQAKVGDTVLGPAISAAGRWEPHPFGAVLTRLMELRGLSDMDLAIRCGLARATICGVSSGGRNPHPVLVAHLARGLGIPEGDLLAAAGL